MQAAAEAMPFMGYKLISPLPALAAARLEAAGAGGGPSAPPAGTAELPTAPEPRQQPTPAAPGPYLCSPPSRLGHAARDVTAAPQRHGRASDVTAPPSERSARPRPPRGTSGAGRAAAAQSLGDVPT